jgi:hypothetical protein
LLLVVVVLVLLLFCVPTVGIGTLFAGRPVLQILPKFLFKISSNEEKLVYLQPEDRFQHKLEQVQVFLYELIRIDLYQLFDCIFDRS